MQRLRFLSDIFWHAEEHCQKVIPSPWIYWLALPHELFHYLPARLLGLKAFIGSGETSVQHNAPRWKKMIVTLCPLVVTGILLHLFWRVLFALAWKDRILEFLCFGSVIGWITSCGLDIRDAYNLIRSSRCARNVSLDRIPYLMWVRDESKPTPRSLKDT